MTNEMIIANAAQQLAQEGAIKYTGRVFKARDRKSSCPKPKRSTHTTHGKPWAFRCSADKRPLPS